MSAETGLKQRIEADMKSALRAGDKVRLGTVRLILAAVKQREIDERIALDDVQVTAVLEKMLKQRRDSIEQFEKAGREDLAGKERFEQDVIQGYMPPALDEDTLDTLIGQAIAGSGASGVKDMGKVMAVLRAEVQGRADMAAVSAKVKARLSAA